MPRIIIEASIGYGKSTLIDVLQSCCLDYTVLEEPVSQFTLLEKFYEDKKKFAYPLQKEIQEVLIQQEIEHSDKDNLITERSAGSCEYFAKVLNKLGYLTNEETEEFEIEECPDLVIKIDCPTETALNRIQRRGRKFEESIDLNYLNQLESELNDYLKKLEKRGTTIYRFNNDDGHFTNSFINLLTFLCKNYPTKK